MRPLTQETPKILLTVGRRTMLEHIIEWLMRYHLKTVHLCLGKKAESILDYIHSRSWPIPITTQIEERPLGTGGALRLAHIEGHWRGAALIVNGDLLTDMDLLPLHNELSQSIALIRNKLSCSDFGCIQWDSNSGKIETFKEKCLASVDVSWVNAGVYRLSPTALSNFNNKESVSLEQDVFPYLIEKGILKGIPVLAEHWFDMGVPQRFLEGQSWIVAQSYSEAGENSPVPGIDCSPDVILGKDCQLHPPIVIRSRSQIGDGAKIGPNVVIGEDCDIGSHAVLTSVYMGSGVNIGSRCELESVIMDHTVRLGDAVRLRECIIAAGSHLGTESHIF